MMKNFENFGQFDDDGNFRAGGKEEFSQNMGFENESRQQTDGDYEDVHVLSSHQTMRE